MRVGAAIFIILYHLYNVIPVKYLSNFYEIMPQGECMRDYTFIWTSQFNDFFADHSEFKRKTIVISSFFMDFMQMLGLLMFYLRYFTVRTPIAFAILFPLRQLIQNIFLMGRPSGFLWSDPGIPSITVPYHDTNDFFFSGHVGASVIYLLEFKA